MKKAFQKYKSHAHKEENSFKFETFNAKLNKINISAVNNLKRRLTENDQDQDISFFATALEKWTDLNCTYDFRQFRQKIGSPLDIQNLVQIIHKKEILIEILLEEMQNPENKGLNAILELLIALARDLQSEFYEYFPSIFDRLVCLSIQNGDPEIIENIFVCQIFLFKYLWKFIIKDMDDHFKIFKKALTNVKEYIVNFASEAFAFLLRRSKEPEKLFNIIFENVKDKNLIRATGRIIFETIKGIQGNFNQKAHIYLTICFEQLISKQVSKNFLEAMKHFISLILDHIQQKEAFKLIWKFLFDSLTKISSTQLSNLFELIHQIVQYKRCKYVIDSLNVSLICAEYLSNYQELDEETKKKLLEIIEKIFLFKYEDLYPDKMSAFCEKFFSTNYQPRSLSLKDILNFTIKIILSPIYDKILCKYLNKMFFEIISSKTTKTELDNKLAMIEFMSCMILQKRSIPLYGKELNKIPKYLLEFDDNEIVVEKLCHLICDAPQNFQIIYCCLIILSNISTSRSDLCDFVKTNIFDTIELHLSKKHEILENQNIYTKILFETTIFFIIQKSYNLPIIELNLEKFLTFIAANPFCLEVLQAFDMFLSHNKSIKSIRNEFTEELNKAIQTSFPLLEMNLSSPFRLNRIVALHILSLLNLKLPSLAREENPDSITIFQICLEAESILVDLANYRERLRLIWKLDCNFVSLYIPEPLNGIQFDMIPVCFLLGTLYENLSVLWKPIVEILETYAKCSNKINQFLDILFDHFKQTLSFIKMTESSNDNPNIWKNIAIDSISKSDISIPDHLNHRLWLLKSFEKFPNIVERKNFEFVELFFRFLSEEFDQHHICRITSRENITNPKEFIDLKNDDEIKINSKILWETFFAFLEVFEKFKNPKAMHKESQLYQIYLNLLSSPNSLCQKHAFNCLLTYNYSYLKRYRENFLRLIDDKSFTSEINSFMFRDNVDDNIIAHKDRTDVIPFFLRILIGKMVASSGTKTHGKSKVDFMRSLIFKILSSFDANQQIMFMNFVYASLDELLKTNYENILSKLIDFIDLEAFIPFKHFQSFITTLEFLMKHFGNQSTEVMQYMFKVLIICSLFCSNLLSSKHRSKIKDHIVDSLKTFRTNCFKVAEYFFINFHNYPFKSIEIDLLFESLVQPLITNLNIESQNFPSPLLRLFYGWSENPRYFILLIKHVEPRNQNLTPIESIIQLYSSPKLSKVTISFINKLIENLLTLDYGEEPSIQQQQIQINNLDYPIQNSEQHPLFKNRDINFGSLILIPYIKDIVERIKLNHTTKINPKFAFTMQEINILAQLSLYVTDPDDSKTIMILLLYSISKNKRPEEDKEISTLKILTHLSNNLSEESFLEILRSTYNLFILVEKPLPRKELCNFLLNLSKKNESFMPMAQIINNLNSFNPRFPEEPDYDRRISTFKEVSNHFENSNHKNSTDFSPVQLEFISLLFFNCAFFITTFDDLSLRELSTETIVKTSQLFRNCSDNIFNKYLINLVLFNIIPKGIRNSKESISNEFISLLVEIIRSFPSKNIFIDQLISLCHKDEELDFWQNIKHIQLHRRARALYRLVQNKELLISISSRIYLKFLIPIVNNLINYSSHPGHHNNVALFNASVDALATFLQYCPWIKYDTILSHYINGLLDNKIDSKIAIRIISTLLEKFSFLKPEQVSVIERTFNENDFVKITSEYSFDYRNKSSKSSTNKFNKKRNVKKEQKLTSSDENKCEQEQELELDFVDDMAFGGSENFHNNLRYYKKIYDSLCRKLLPLLHKCLHQRSQIDNVHDLNKHEEFADDEEIQTIPIGIAIVKLLKYVQLDQRVFETNLNSVILRLCQFLQSKAHSIRETARKTLAQVLEVLGPKYFSNIFYEMKVLLCKGYQRHVFIYTIHVLLQRLFSQLNVGDLNSCMLDMIEVCHQELFGLLSEEKEISQIITKTKEAKKIKAYDIYEIIARFVSESSMETMIDPLKTLMLESCDHKTMHKIEKAFHRIGCGLVHNQHISIGTLMKFLNEIFVSTLAKKDEHEEQKKSMEISKKIDSFIIPEKSLRRVNQVSKVNSLSHRHILSNFALECYLYILKNNKLIKTEGYEEILNQTLCYLETFLKHSNDLKVITNALSCILLLLTKFSTMISFENYSHSIITQIFFLLQKHSGLNDENRQLTTLCFKTIAHFINIRSECKLTDQQISILLSYADNDIEKNNQNVAIYFLLKSIIARKFVSKELHQLMERLMILAITTDIDHVRENAVDLYIKYLTDYPIDSNRLKGKLLKIARQLEVDNLTGRKAAITILKAVIQNFSCDILAPLRNHLFLIMSSRLINEDSPECSKIIDETIQKLFSKLSSENLDDFFENFVLPWLNSDTLPIQTMSCNLCCLFLEYEKSNFEKRILFCIGPIAEHLNPECFKSLTPSSMKINDIKIKEEDNLLFSHLNFLFKLFKMENIMSIIIKVKFQKYLNEMLNNIVSSFLLHPHTWIRNISTQIFGQVFSLFDPESFDGKKNSSLCHFFLFENSEEKMVHLARKFCLIFRDIYACQFMAEQLIKNLIYIARVFIVLDFVRSNDDNHLAMENNHQKTRSLLEWLVKKLLFEINFEIKNKPNETRKRVLFLKWLAAVSLKLGHKRIYQYLPYFLPPLCRENISSSFDNPSLSSESGGNGGNDELKNLTKQILQMFRNMVGSEQFIGLYNKIRNQISHRRLERRKQRAVQMVTHMVAGIKRKQQKHKRSQQSKRRKVKLSTFNISSL